MDNRESTNYLLRDVSGTNPENERLDDLHEALKSFLGGNLSLAPLESSKPKRILEIGSGSGAWAIQAAETFHEAEVLAIDITSLPARTLPSNLTFKIIDVTQPFPAELQDEGYDIVHARLVFIHLPHAEEIIRRTAQLVRPGGWLLLGDAHEPTTVKCDPRRFPGLSSFWKLLQSSLRARDMDPFIGTRCKEILQSTGLFSEVNAREILIPLSNSGIDATGETSLQRIGGSCRRGLLRTVGNTPIGMTPDLIQSMQKELDDPNAEVYTELVMTWSKRHVV